MLKLFLLTLLAMALIAPPIILARREDKLSWTTRYALSALPAACTWSGYKLAVLSLDWLHCKGGMKGAHDCFFSGVDVAPLVDRGLFLGIPFLFIAAPLSLWLLLNTSAKQIGAWHRRNYPGDGQGKD